MKSYTDVADLPEDQRIEIIANAVKETTERVGFFIDCEPEKIARYTRKLEARGVVVVESRAVQINPTVRVQFVRVAAKGN